MKKLILPILIIFSSFCTINALASDLNNNKNRKCPELPDDAWREIALQLINIETIKEAKTIPELKKGFYKFLLLSKKHNKLAVDLANKEFEINEKKITLKNFYIQRKNEILKEIMHDKLNWKFDINQEDEYGHTALICAILSKEKEITELLIQNGTDLNIQTNLFGWTPLMYAVQGNNKELIELLIQAGADLNIRDNTGLTALIWSVYNNNKEIIELLLNNGANTDSISLISLFDILISKNREISELIVQNKISSIEFKRHEYVCNIQ